MCDAKGRKSIFRGPNSCFQSLVVLLNFGLISVQKLRVSGYIFKLFLLSKRQRYIPKSAHLKKPEPKNVCCFPAINDLIITANRKLNTHWSTYYWSADATYLLFYSVSLTLTHTHTQITAHTSREAVPDAHQRHNVRITAWIARILLLTFRRTLTQEKSVPINSLQIKQISERTGTGANKTQGRGSQGWTHSTVAANTHRHAHLDLTDRLRPHWSQWDALTFAHIHTHAQTHARMWCKLSTGFPPSISL